MHAWLRHYIAYICMRTYPLKNRYVDRPFACWCQEMPTVFNNTIQNSPLMTLYTHMSLSSTAVDFVLNILLHSYGTNTHYLLVGSLSFSAINQLTSLLLNVLLFDCFLPCAYSPCRISHK